jgi:hypothetical protein
VHLQEEISRKTTHRQRIVNGNNAGPQGLHVLVVFKPVLPPRGVILVN